MTEGQHRAAATILAALTVFDTSDGPAGDLLTDAILDAGLTDVETPDAIAGAVVLLAKLYDDLAALLRISVDDSIRNLGLWLARQDPALEEV